MDQSFIDRARRIEQAKLGPDAELAANFLLVTDFMAARLVNLPGDVADRLAALRSFGLEATADALSRLITPDGSREPVQL